MPFQAVIADFPRHALDRKPCLYFLKLLLLPLGTHPPDRVVQNCHFKNVFRKIFSLEKLVLREVADARQPLLASFKHRYFVPKNLQSELGVEKKFHWIFDSVSGKKKICHSKTQLLYILLLVFFHTPLSVKRKKQPFLPR